MDYDDNKNRQQRYLGIPFCPREVSAGTDTLNPDGIGTQTINNITVHDVCIRRRLWMHVSAAIAQSDQQAATREKYILEEAQRQRTRARREKDEEWLPELFEQSPLTDEWQYKYAE